MGQRGASFGFKRQFRNLEQPMSNLGDSFKFWSSGLASVSGSGAAEEPIWWQFRVLERSARYAAWTILYSSFRINSKAVWGSEAEHSLCGVDHSSQQLQNREQAR